MTKQIRRLAAIGISALIILSGVVSGAPGIQVDSADYDAGVIREGSAKRISHVFRITNTGDEPLIVEKVRTG